MLKFRKRFVLLYDDKNKYKHDLFIDTNVLYLVCISPRLEEEKAFYINYLLRDKMITEKWNKINK
jgi:hypothetical protein